MKVKIAVIMALSVIDVARNNRVFVVSVPERLSIWQRSVGLPACLEAQSYSYIDLEMGLRLIG